MKEKTQKSTYAIACILLLFLAGCRSNSSDIAPTATTENTTNTTDTTETVSYEYHSSQLGLFGSLPDFIASEEYEATDNLIDLGRMLYYDPRLSIDQEMSCNTCHLLDQYGAEPLATSLSHDGIPGHRNAPTVYNAALHISQFWDGRMDTVEEQALGPILAGGEMGMPDEEFVLEMLSSIPEYVELFAEAFPDQTDSLTYENVGIAIGAFERGLVTPSRFDDLINGDESALTDAEKEGLATFVQVGCTTCHLGPAIGGQFYRKLGQLKPYETEDLGRYDVTGEEIDKHVFKVPSLRNVTATGPYFHDGSIETLEEAIDIMAEYQLARELTDAEITAIMTFLATLEGEIPTEYIAEPQLPENGPDTPAPQTTNSN